MDHRRRRRRARRLTLPRSVHTDAQTTLRLWLYGQNLRVRSSARCSSARRCPRPRAAQHFEDVGIRAQGMAGAFVAVADDATATWWNPAGLAHRPSFVDGHCRGGIVRGHWGVAFGFPALGLSYYHLNISQIQPSSLYSGRRLEPTRSRSCRNRSACVGFGRIQPVRGDGRTVDWRSPRGGDDREAHERPVRHAGRPRPRRDGGVRRLSARA